jgi:hypothetical protein
VDDDPELRFESDDDRIIYFVQRAADQVREAEGFYRKIADTATRLPVETAMTLWQGATDRRRWTRRYLRHVFG